MIQTLKNNALVLVAALTLALGLTFALTVPAAAADINGNLCSGASLSVTSGSGSGTCDKGSGEAKLNDLITNVVNIFSIVVGIISVIMIIFGGFRYITSGGDSAKVTAAKNTIIYAIIGLVIVALAQVIVRLVLGQTSGI